MLVLVIVCCFGEEWRGGIDYEYEYGHLYEYEHEDEHEYEDDFEYDQQRC